ncbi:MAG: PaaI family thioesterase [Candidatus Binatia bacterium]
MISDQFAALGASFEAAPYNASLGVRVESLEPGRARLRVPYKDENSNPGRALHGGVAASAINIGGALAAWTGLNTRPELETGTLDLSVNYLAAAIGEDIIATAEVLRRGKEIVYSDVDVRNQADKRIAKGLVTYRAFDYGSQPAARQRQRAVMPDIPATTRALIQGARAFVSVPFIARLGIVVEHAQDGQAVLGMPFKHENADAGDAVHEGALAALVDTSGALASWSITGLNFAYKASTVGIHVNYLARAWREEVVAHARTLRRNNEIFLNTVTVSGRRSGHVIAAGSVTYRIVVTD